ncbi:MAG: hypothetical protein KC502_05320, partial [Myxococcales bacterium]|nr:hypothetical protein [Myxococcales bacterium]
MLLIAFLPQPAEARRGAAPWTPVPVSAWLGPLTSAAVPAALRGKPVPGRDGPACWRAVPKSLAAEAAQRPVRLQGLVERAGSGVVLAAAEICLRAPGPVRLAVTSPAALELAVDGHPVTTLTLWSAARYRPISARHITAMKLAAGCHRLVAALRSPSGRLGLRWWVAGRGVSIARPARPARDAQCLRGWAPRPAA